MKTRGRSIRAVWLGLLLIPGAAIVAFIGWPSVGRSVTVAADRIVTVPISTPSPTDKIAYDGDFRIGGLTLTSGTLNNYPFKLVVCTDAANMVVLKSGGHSFILGPRTNPVDSSGRPDIDFIPERGDAVSLTASRSLVGWPTPFEVTIMTQSPLWKRYVTYRLVWKKRSGATLVMLWRYEQDYFKARGWIRPTMMWDFHTGLLRVDIDQNTPKEVMNRKSV
ncbi:MAG TPA: hypothetical protein VGG69_01430 [Rhizomicrobium sp.]